MRRTIAIALAGGLLLAGCGDEDEEEPAATQSEAPAQTQAETQSGSGDADATRVVLSDFAIDPANPTVPAGTVTFEVVNEGEFPHRLEIEGNGAEAVTETLEGTGDEATLEAELEPGDYEWYCPIGNHREQGMDGTLTVE